MNPNEPTEPNDLFRDAAEPAYPSERTMPPPPDGGSKWAIAAGVLAALLVLAAITFWVTRNDTPDAAVDTTVAATTTSEDPGSATTTTSMPDTTAAGATLDYEPRFEEARCEFSLVANATPRCGWLVVPEDRQNPDNGREVRIHVAMFDSYNADAPEDPIIYLDGGPGGTTLDPLQFTFTQFWEPFLANRDLILFDQRGVGYSEPSLDCPEEREWSFSVLDQDLDAEEERRQELAVLQQCRERLVADGVDLSQYNSVENAADVADLRTALGLDEVNLLGISYGTRLAATVMRDHPEGLRSVVLDSTYTLDVDLTSSGPVNLARAMGELWEGCQIDVDCAARYPNLEDRFLALVDRYNEQPVEAEVRDFLNGGTWDVLFDGDWLLGTLFQGLYSEQVIPLIPQLVEELEAGDTSTLTLLTSNTLANAEFLSFGMHLSVQCHEEVPFTSEADIAAGLEGFDELNEAFDGASNLGDFMLEACAMWQAGTADPTANEPVQSDITTLVLAGEYDPITPPEWGRIAATTLPNSTFIEFPGLGHGTSLAEGCPRDITLAFFDDPTATVDTSCVAEMDPIDFRIPGEPPPPITLVAFTETVLNTEISGLVPEDWTAIGLGGYTRGESAVDQTAIVQQVIPLATPSILVPLLTSQFNLDSDPEPVGEVDSALGTWETYRGTSDDFAFDIALIEHGAGTAMIVLVSDPAERDSLREQVLLPAIDAFRTG